MIKMQSKESKIKTTPEIACCREINMMEDRPGGIGFTSGFSQDSINITVVEQITVEQLIEKYIIMRISRHDHVYRHHVRHK